ncbi:MAG: nodulation protein NodH [Gemmobacter sp.]
MTPARPFDRFILLAGMRTGSNFLEDNINAIPGLACHGEAFNPHFIGAKDRMEYLGLTIADRDRDPFALIARIEAAGPDIAGFRFFHDHDPRVLARSLADRRCAKIVLTRNPLDAFVSLQIARATGQWKLGDARRRRSEKVRFDAAAFAAYLAEQQGFHLHILHALQTTGQAAFHIGYDDLGDPAVIEGLAAFLGVPVRLDDISRTVKKQNPEPLEDKLLNPEAVEAAVAALDPFGLARTPWFEPRRGPAVPNHVAAAGAPILWLPIPGGPDAAVAGWLAGVRRPGAAAGTVGGFAQKTLRDWLRANPGARSFTVLRHPLARAHAAFCSRILTGAAGEVVPVLRRAWKLDLPRPDRAAGMSVEAHRAAFLGFLRFVKGNIAGQTGVRIDAAWASQAAVIDGFAQTIRPDHILREDRLAAGLAFLAAEVGAAAPPPAPAPDTAPVPLRLIADAEVQAAAREAYARDHAAFGFGDWTPDAEQA